jgi:hypothetical protein
MIDTSLYKTIELREIEKVKLMNRIDKKYWFHQDILKDLFQELHNNYYLLSVDGHHLSPYYTTYYDTFENFMYTSHHNGKLNRYKIRKRTYRASNSSFLEIKFKNNKGRTIKTRIPSRGNVHFSLNDVVFINKNTPFNSLQLNVALTNKFNRITLVNKNFTERCTIDTNLKCWNNNTQCTLNNLVIAEVKSEQNGTVSLFEKALKKYGISPAGFSKYCIGRSVVDKNIKKNAFKRKLLRIEKMIHDDWIEISNN